MSDEFMYSDNLEQQLAFLLDRNRLEQAEKLLSTALAENPDNPSMLYFSAYVEHKKDNYKEAERILLHLLKMSPKDGDALFLLCEVFYCQDKYSDAERIIIELLREYPEDPEYYAFYGHIMLQTMHLDKAGKLTHEALMLDHENLSALVVATLCDLIENKDDKAGEKLQMMVREYPEAETTTNILLMTLMENNRYKEAKKIARQLVINNPLDEENVEIMRELKVLTHPTMLPLWPVTVYGWNASAVFFGVFLFINHLVSKYSTPKYSLIISFTIIGYCVYSWVYPPILRRILR